MQSKRRGGVADSISLRSWITSRRMSGASARRGRRWMGRRIRRRGSNRAEGLGDEWMEKGDRDYCDVARNALHK